MATPDDTWRALRARIKDDAREYLKQIRAQGRERLERLTDEQRKMVEEEDRRLVAEGNPMDRRQRRAARKEAIAAEEARRSKTLPRTSEQQKIRDLNRVSRKYAEGMAAPFRNRASLRPDLLLTEAGFERLQAEAMAVFEERSAEATQKAKKPRPKKRATYRGECIARMRSARQNQHSLPEFLAAVQNDDDVFSIERTDNRDANEYLIHCGAVTSDKDKNTFKLETLKDWWKAAAQKSKVN